MVGELVQVPTATAEIGGGHLAGETHHGRTVTHSGAERRAGVQHAGTGHHGKHARAAGGFGVAHRHVARGLLVAGNDELDSAAVQPVEQRIDLRARHAEDRGHAVRACGVDDGLADRDFACLVCH